MPSSSTPSERSVNKISKENVIRQMEDESFRLVKRELKDKCLRIIFGGIIPAHLQAAFGISQKDLLVRALKELAEEFEHGSGISDIE